MLAFNVTRSFPAKRRPSTTTGFSPTTSRLGRQRGDDEGDGAGDGAPAARSGAVATRTPIRIQSLDTVLGRQYSRGSVSFTDHCASRIRARGFKCPERGYSAW